MSADLIELRLVELSARIKKGRESESLTLVELGERSGVAPSTIQKIENRQMTPSIAVSPGEAIFTLNAVTALGMAVKGVERSTDSIFFHKRHKKVPR